MKKGYYIVSLILFLYFPVKAQDSTTVVKPQLSGYVSNLQTVMFSDISGDWMNDNTVHNRLNFSYEPGTFSFNLQLRNRFIYGDQVRLDSTYARSLGRDKGIMDLSANLVSKKSFVLNSQIDRAYVTFKKQKFEATIGRQRINWGQTFVWNPNDLFNTYSFFDFDYPERPGSDAIRLQYFTGFASQAEFAVKSDSSGKVTLAGFYKFNKWNYDIQFLGGIYEDNDFVIGAGWSGGIAGMGFYGEISYFKPLDKQNDGGSTFYSSMALNYAFPNSLNLQGEVLFAKIPGGFSYNSILEVLNRPLNVKNLAFSEYSIFTQASYPITPLLNATLSAMYMPSIKAWFLGPNLDYSLGDNISASLLVQSFRARFPQGSSVSLFSGNFTIGFLRVKVNF